MNAIAASAAAQATGIAGVGAAEAAELGAVHDLRAAGDGADRKPAAQRLGHGHEIGLDSVVLAGKHPAGAAEARLHFVDDEQDAVLAGNARSSARRLRAAPTTNPPSPSTSSMHDTGDLLGGDVGRRRISIDSRLVHAGAPPGSGTV